MTLLSRRKHQTTARTFRPAVPVSFDCDLRAPWQRGILNRGRTGLFLLALSAALTLGSSASAVTVPQTSGGSFAPPPVAGQYGETLSPGYAAPQQALPAFSPDTSPQHSCTDPDCRNCPSGQCSSESMVPEFAMAPMPDDISPHVDGPVPTQGDNNWQREASSMMSGDSIDLSPSALGGGTFASPAYVPEQAAVPAGHVENFDATYAANRTVDSNDPQPRNVEPYYTPERPAGSTGFVPPVHAQPEHFSGDAEEMTIEQLAAQHRADNARRQFAQHAEYEQSLSELNQVRPQPVAYRQQGRQPREYRAAQPQPPMQTRQPVRSQASQAQYIQPRVSAAPEPVVQAGYQGSGARQSAPAQPVPQGYPMPVGQQPYAQPVPPVSQVPATFSNQPAAAAQPQEIQMRPPVALPADIGPPNTRGFQPRPDTPANGFRRRQLSSTNLTERRGPGLQDRIENLLTSARYAGTNLINSAIPNRGGNYQGDLAAPQFQQEIVSSPPMQSNLPMYVTSNEPVTGSSGYVEQPGMYDSGMNQAGMNRGSLSIGESELHGSSSMDDRLADLERREQAVQKLEEELIARREASVARAERDLREEVEPLLRDGDVTTAAMDRGTDIEPVQDPFLDYPPLRGSDVSHAHEEIAMLDERGNPISVLDRGSLRDRPNSFRNSSYRGTPRLQDEQESAGAFDPLQAPEDQEEELIAPQDSDDPLEQLPSPNRPGGDDDDTDLRDPGEDDDELEDTAPVETSCAEFQRQLLDQPLTGISLDISPPRFTRGDGYVAISRSWTDRRGSILATGTMVDLRRGYVIVETGGGTQKISFARLSDADLAAVSEAWNLPVACTIGDRPFNGRNWTPQTVTWKASGLCHNPLYFENVQLERYGHSRGPFAQPVHSVGHFFKSLITVPYQSAINPPNECRYALGYYRPGDCAPWLKEPFPMSVDGLRRELAVGAALFIVP